MLGLDRQNTRTCLHCGTRHNRLDEFCCGGCESVYNFLQSHDLGNFYKLKSSLPVRKAEPIRKTDADFSELRNYSTQSLEFYLEGIHCLGCLWLLEKLPEIHVGVLEARLDISSSVLTVLIDSRTNFQSVALAIQNLGYRPHAIEKNSTNFRSLENRTLLGRLGIAAACAGNIMLLAVSIYAGAEGVLARQFAWLSFVLAIPVITYSAIPIYISAWSGLHTKVLNVDLPIALAIVAGVVASLASLLRGGNEVYFDSLSTLVFLLLASRYVLRRLQQGYLKNPDLLDFMNAKKVLCLNNGGSKYIPISEIKTHDQLWIAHDEVLPCDGIARSEGALLDLSLLTGESIPQSVKSGENIYAGTKNIGDGFELRCTAVGASTRLGRILMQLSTNIVARTPLAGFADKLAKWFIGIVLMIACGLLIYFHTNLAEGIRRSLTLVIVTCPCVLAFAIPLSLALSTRMAAKRGLLLRSPGILEKIPEITTIFLDKTGTVTDGMFRILSWMEDAAESQKLRNAVYSLGQLSRHPVARAITRFLEKDAKELAVQNFKEMPGKGMSGNIEDAYWEVHRSNDTLQKNNHVDIYRDGTILARITLGDNLLPNLKNTLSSFFPREIHLLSGDRKNIALAAAEQLGIPPANVHAEKSPEEKSEIVHKYTNALMAGDGNNDALALRAAAVGVAVHGGAELSLKNADIFLSKPGLTGLVELFEIAELNRRITVRNFIFSAIYNIIAGFLAISGAMNPLLAAVLMPLSALTVFISTGFFIKLGDQR